MKYFSLQKNISFLITSIQIESLPFFFNQWKINLFAFIINFFLIISLFLYNNHLFDFIYFFNSFFEDIYSYFNSTAYCAGIPKLLTIVNDDNLKDNRNEISNELYSYKLNSEIINLSKYNFDLLERNNDFFENRKTIIELINLSEEFNFIHNQNIKVLNNIFYDAKNIDNNTDFLIVEKKINLFLIENLFKIENIILCNIKLGIPLYEGLYLKAYYSTEILPLFYKSNIDKTLIKEKPFPLSKDLNFFDIKLNIILDEDKKNSLVILKQDKTIFDKTMDKQLIKNRIFFKPNSESYGAPGIIEEYIYFTECMFKTIFQLKNSNDKIENLYKIISNPNFEKKLLLKKDFCIESESDFIDFYKSKIIEKTILPNSKEFFKDENFINKEEVKLKFKKINNIFLTQLKKDSSMLKDIHNQKSNMHVNYTKLKKIMNNTELEEFFDDRVKTRIINASNGIFNLKRPRD